MSYVRSMQVCRKAIERFANGRKSPANTSIKREQTSIDDAELLPNTLSFHFPPALISMLKNSLRDKVGIVKVQKPHWRVQRERTDGQLTRRTVEAIIGAFKTPGHLKSLFIHLLQSLSSNDGGKQ